uniref:Uncharacterized protein n=1 Tax=Vitis vinifera TaxID=29760 RepID=F6I3S2_VITVI
MFMQVTEQKFSFWSMNLRNIAITHFLIVKNTPIPAVLLQNFFKLSLLQAAYTNPNHISQSKALDIESKVILYQNHHPITELLYLLSFFQLSGSAMLNLSLLTSDMWAVLIRIFAYHQKVDWMYFMAFAAVVVGLIIYSGGGKGDEQHYAEIADEDAERSRYFDEKAGLLGNSDHSSIVGGSRIGDSSKHGSASSGIARQDDSDNKRMEKDAQWKTG